MAVFKCKMCGGDLVIEQGSTVAECEYCGSVQTVPTADNEKKMTLFARANRLRAANEFDKAAGIYETIVADFPEEAEAYWGLVLCKYGIEYVDDPATGKKVPTCHRSGFDNVLDDKDLELVLENADPAARRVYREEAKQIEELRRGIIEVSGREEPYDIFICYKETAADGQRTLDSVLAQDVYDQLVDNGYRVFFSRVTLEDKLGTEYEPYIFAALNSAKVMLAFGTDYEYFNAVWVKNEWSRFLKLMEKDKTKHLIPCYKNIDVNDMPREFVRLQAQDLGKVGAVQDLLRGIKKIIPKEAPKQEAAQPVVQQVVQQVVQGGPSTASLLKRAFMALEDGNFKGADEFAEQVLNIDPENAEAYVAKLMANLQVRSRGSLKNCSQPFEYNTNCTKAIRFGDAKLKAELNGYNSAIKERNALNEKTRLYNSAVSLMGKAATEADFKSAAEAFGKVPGFKDSSSLAKTCLENAETARKDAAYNDCVKAVQAANTAASNKSFDEAKQKYEKAAGLFAKIPGWKDAEKLAGDCREKGDAAGKDGIYHSAAAAMQKADALSERPNDLEKAIGSCEEAIRGFKAVPGWKDADALAEQCGEKIERFKNEMISRDRAKRQAKNRAKVIAIAVAALAAVGAFLFLLFTKLIPDGKYNKACELMNAGQYDEAIEAFTQLSGYKDSDDKITDCRYNSSLALMNDGKYDEAISLFYQLGYTAEDEEIMECHYQKAIALLDAGDNDEAQALFEKLGDYKETDGYMRELRYRNAVKLMSEGRNEEALKLFRTLADYKDSAELFKALETAVTEEKYSAAVDLYNEGKYEEAIEAFTALNGYKDSAAKADEIRNEYYNKLFLNASVGSKLFFGSYEQDGITTNGKEDIEWIVLAKDGLKALVISRYALDQGLYHQSYTNTTWETCSLRKWLNETFLKAAFSSKEQSHIISSTVTADNNSKYGTPPGNNTTDKVFLLSIAEINEYFDSDSARQCSATVFCYEAGAYKTADGYCKWWLRSPGTYANQAMYVSSDGVPSFGGSIVNYDQNAIRPAMWIELKMGD